MTTDPWAGNCPTCGTAGSDAQALADVRTLDEWRAAGVERKFEEFDFISGEDEPKRYFVFAINTNNEPLGRFAHETYRGSSPEEARSKAAAWVRGLK